MHRKSFSIFVFAVFSLSILLVGCGNVNFAPGKAVMVNDLMSTDSIQKQK